MYTAIDYVNNSTDIFPGFYESIIYNSDTVYYVQDYFDDDLERDIADFDKFQNEIANEAAKLLAQNLASREVVKSIDYKGLWSPQFYNFETDKLKLKVEVDIGKLNKYCFVWEKQKFGEYLKDNFSLRDGFISFIANNIDDFKTQLKSDKNRCIQVMVEFYLLNSLDLDSYMENLVSVANEVLFENLEVVKND